MSKVDPTNNVAHRYEGLFIALQVIGGQIGLPLFIATMLLARTVKRHYILVNFCFSWIVYSVAYCLTIYAGGEPKTGPNSKLCIAQASLVFGVVPLAVTTYCTLHIQVWLGLRAAFYENTWTSTYRKRILVVMFYIPYAVFAIFTSWALVVCLKFPEVVDKTQSYHCTIDNNAIVPAVPAYAAAIIVIMLILEVHMAFTIIPRWKIIRRTRAISAASLSMISRICVFGVYGLATFIACISFSANSLNFWSYTIQASLPTAIFCVFGTRKDVWMAWCFWKKQSADDEMAVTTARSQNMLDSQISIEEGTLTDAVTEDLKGVTVAQRT